MASSEAAGRSAGTTALAEHARLCTSAFGAELTAYLAGAGSVREWNEWLADAAAARTKPMALRLATAMEVINIFAVHNRTSMAGPWLREINSAGLPPARVIRASAGDGTVVKALLQAASCWVVEASAGEVMPAAGWPRSPARTVPANR
jgi:hypothetical protein